MEKDKFTILKNSVQKLIDCIAAKNSIEAQLLLQQSSELLEELLDLSESDEDLIKISHYQVLLNQLHQKIVSKPE
jgi:hypothetical protein